MFGVSRSLLLFMGGVLSIACGSSASAEEITTEALAQLIISQKEIIARQGALIQSLQAAQPIRSIPNATVPTAANLLPMQLYPVPYRQTAAPMQHYTSPYGQTMSPMQAIMMPNGQVYVVVPAQPQQVAPMMIPPQQMVQQQPMVMPQPQVMPVQPQYYAAPPQQQPVVIPQQSVVIPQQPMVAPQQRRPPVQVAKTVPRQTAQMIQGGRKKKPRFYAGLRGIYSSLNDLDGILHRDAGSLSFSESAGFGVAVGYRLSDAIRGEVEFSRHQYDLKEFYDRGANTLSEAAGEVTFNTTMISGYYDYLNDSQFTPYIGAGVGATLLEVDRAANFASGGVSGSQLESRSSLSGEQWVPSIMLSAGSTYDLNEQLSLDLAYRALFTGDVAGTHDNRTGSSDEIFSHNALFGLMYSFDGF